MPKVFQRITNLFRPNRVQQEQAPPLAYSRGYSGPEAMLIVDAIHDRLDQKSPYGSPEGAIERLTHTLREKLHPGARAADGTFATGFGNIRRTPTDLFHVHLQNGQSITRDHEEIELHIMLQSQLRRATAFDADFGDSMSSADLQGEIPVASTSVSGPVSSNAIPASTVASSTRVMPRTLGQTGQASRLPIPTQPPQFSLNPSGPSALGPAQSSASDTLANSRDLPGPTRNTPAVFIEPDTRTDELGNVLTTFYSSSVDMVRINEMLHGVSHQVKEIAGASANCWWRGGWASAIMQHAANPAELEANILRILPPDYADDARRIRSLAEAYCDQGVRALFTGMETGDLETAMQCPSRLRSPDRASAESAVPEADEEIFQRLTFALLTTASDNGHLSEAQQLRLPSAVFGDGMGELEDLATLMKMLGATLLLFGKPWKQDSIGQWAVESSSITVGAQPDSPLADLQFSPDARSCTAAFLQASDTTPAFVHQGTHFNLCIPSYCLIKAF